MPKKIKKAHKSLIFPIKTKKAMILLYQSYSSLMVPPGGVGPPTDPYHGSVIPIN